MDSVNEMKYFRAFQDFGVDDYGYEIIKIIKYALELELYSDIEYRKPKKLNVVSILKWVYKDFY